MPGNVRLEPLCLRRATTRLLRHNGDPGRVTSRSPGPRVREGDEYRLVQRRERCRDDEHVLLADELAARRRRPRARLLRLGADPEALGRILVGPNMDPLVEPADLGRAGE